MATNKDFDKKQNISRKTALQIQSNFLSLDQSAIRLKYEKFKSQEKFMGPVVDNIANLYAKLIINNTLLTPPDVNDINQATFNSDPVDDAMSVADAYNAITNILYNTFLIGLHSGMAISDSNFNKLFDIDNTTNDTPKKEKTITIQKNTDINDQIAKQMKDFINLLFSNNNIDSITYEEKEEEEDDEE